MLSILYDKDRLLYPHHLEYGYTGIACMDKDNYQMNLSPTPKDIEDLCGFTLKE